uniref:THAP domaincontaining protein 9like [Hydra vulgaris] n=1 Tax=Lepeophtheirus salmonis TaxID=72036 RepID=A0A0K2V7V8_LEPSM
MKMKVNLACQTLSRSVADVFDILSKDLQYRNILGSSTKSPLRTSNYDYWRPLLESSYKYIKELKTCCGQKVVNTIQKIGYVGFLIAIQSFIQLYNYFIETNCLKYILIYKFSQDHLELFFQFTLPTGIIIILRSDSFPPLIKD